jgi:hypothetical protein
MPTPDELKRQKELNDLLEQENRLLKRKLELQSESYDLSSTLVEDLKEVLGIQSRRSTFESGILDINKKINRAIRDQKLEFDEIEDIQKQIKKNADLINKAKLFEKSLENQLKSLGEDKVKKDKNRIQNINEYNQAVVRQRKQLDDILSLSKDERDLRKDEIKELNRKIAKNEQLIQSNFKNLSLTSKQYYLTQKQREELEKINKEREKEKKDLDAIDKKLGITSGLLKGLSKTPFLKDLGIDFNEALEKARQTTSTTKNGVAGLATGLKSVGSQLKEALVNPTNLTLMVMRQLYITIKSVDKATGDLAKAFNITYLQANDVRKRLTGMALDVDDTAVNTRTLQESLIAVGSTLGSNAELNKKDLATFTQMREKAGLTNEELVEMQKLTYVSGVNLEDNVGSLLASAKMTGLNNKMLLNEKDIMRDVAKTSKAIQLSLGGQGKELGHAAAQVKILGMNMKQVEDIAGSLLNFESSISAELEAELLTGKDLNLERARLYAINNDMAGVAREIRKNYGDTAEFAKLNRIQQEAAAKAVGMTREELARTLTDEKALKGLNSEKRNAAQAALDFARAQGMTEAEISKRSIDDLMKQQSVQERLNFAVEQLKESFVIIAETLLPVFDGFADLVGWLAKSKITLGAISVLVGAIAAKSIVTAIANIFGGSARVLGPLAAIAGGITTGIMFASIDSAEDKVPKARNAGDMFSPANGETQVSTKEGGIFTLSKNDDVAAAPGLGDIIKNSNKKSTPDSYWMEMLKNQQNQMTEIIKTQAAQANRPINVSAKVNNRELLNITAATAGERSNIEKTTAYQVA